MARDGKSDGVNRRSFIVAGGAALAIPALLGNASASAAEGPIKVGYVTPQTGPLAFFGEPDAFVLDRFKALIDAGIGSSDVQRPVEFLIRDTQSSPARAAEVAAQLILEDGVSLLLAAGGPDTVNPVADQAEANGVPFLATACPWQPFVLGRGSSPDKGFDWTYLFAFGLEDVIAAYLALWATADTNKKVGVLFANDADGNAWGDAQFGFPPALAAAGYEVVDTGRYTPMSDDFTAQITAFKDAGVDIVVGTMVPPEFFSFWSQAAQQGLKPKIATIGKTLLLPSTLEAIGDNANRLTTELGWHAAYPFRSTGTNQTAAELCSTWETETGRQWIQTIGLKHALVDLAMDVLKRAKDPQDPASVIEAIQATDLETVLGRANWSKSPIKNVAKAPILAGQWIKEGDRFELMIRANPTGEAIPVSGQLELL